jgi:hypothetical protein
MDSSTKNTKMDHLLVQRMLPGPMKAWGFVYLVYFVVSNSGFRITLCSFSPKCLCWLFVCTLTACPGPSPAEHPA